MAVAAHRDERTGTVVLRLPGGLAGRRVRVPGADVVVLVLDGVVRVDVGDDPPRPVPAGSAVVCPHGRPWRLAADGTAARVLVVGHPAGPEALLRALVEDGLDDSTLVAVAHDAGVELLLDDDRLREPARPTVRRCGAAPGRPSPGGSPRP